MSAPVGGSIAVTVRLCCGSYVSSFGGQRASSTMSAEQAALRLAQKLWPGAEVRCELLEYRDPSLQLFRVSWLESSRRKA